MVILNLGPKAYRLQDAHTKRSRIAETLSTFEFTMSIPFLLRVQNVLGLRAGGTPVFLSTYFKKISN